MSNEELALDPGPGVTAIALSPSPISLLERVLQSPELTQEKLGLAKELIQMCREQRADDAKTAFAKALFQLRKNMPEIYIDKEAKDRSGAVAYRYCSEEEISKKLEPHLMAYGFTTLFSQKQDDGRVTVEITLMHERGHETVSEYTVRTGATNAMKDATAADSGAATTAWRHLMMKMFGLKARISEHQDARNEGEKITEDQAIYLREQVKETKSNEADFLRFAGSATYEAIGSARYPSIIAALEKKRRGV
jgi:hypothetical protein